MEGLGEKRRMLLSTLNRDRPASRRARLFASLVYRAPGLREAQGGAWDGLGRVMGTEVVAYARRILRPKRLIIAAVGKVNRPVLTAAAMRFSCPRGAASIPEPGREELASSPLDVVDPKAKASSASVGVGLGPMSREDEMALICTADYLSAKPLVLPSGKQVTPDVSLRVGRVSGHLRLSAKTSQDRMNVLVAVMRLRLRGLAHRGPPRAWIMAWRRRWIAMWRARERSLSWRARNMTEATAAKEPWGARHDAVMALTRRSVKQAAARWIVDPLAVVAVRRNSPMSPAAAKRVRSAP